MLFKGTEDSDHLVRDLDIWLLQSILYVNVGSEATEPYIAFGLCCLAGAKGLKINAVMIIRNK